jgi:hypothetical protein
MRLTKRPGLSSLSLWICMSLRSGAYHEYFQVLLEARAT